MYAVSKGKIKIALNTGHNHLNTWLNISEWMGFFLSKKKKAEKLFSLWKKKDYIII